jgi:cephalosporin hydroxylase
VEDVRTLSESVLRNDPRPIEMQAWQREHPKRWIPARRYYSLMYALARVYEPEVMVELGTDHGYGAWHLAAGNPNGLVVAVDVTFDRLERELIPDNVELVRMDSRAAVGEVRRLADGRPVGLVFFDSTHNREHASEELRLYDPMCDRGAIQLFDDVTESVDMRRFWKGVPEPKLLLPKMHPRWNSKVPGFGVRVRP